MAYLAFDAMQLRPATAGAGGLPVRFELRRAAAPEMPASGAYTATQLLTAEAIAAARDIAFAHGSPHATVAWDIPSGLDPGEYVLVVSAADAFGRFRELSRRVPFAVTP